MARAVIVLQDPMERGPGDMECYYHPENEATTVCAACGKALCRECTDRFGKLVLCKSCKPVIAEKFIQYRYIRQTERRQLNYVLPAAALATGISFLLISLYLFSAGEAVGYVTLTIALLLTIVGAILLVAAYRANKKLTDLFIPEKKRSRTEVIGWSLVATGAVVLVVVPVTGLFLEWAGWMTLVPLAVSLVLLVVGFILVDRGRKEILRGQMRIKKMKTE